MKQVEIKTMADARDWWRDVNKRVEHHAKGATNSIMTRVGTVVLLSDPRRLTHERDPELDATEDLITLVVPRTTIDEMLRGDELPSIACAAIWGLATAGVATRLNPD